MSPLKSFMLGVLICCLAVMSEAFPRDSEQGRQSAGCMFDKVMDCGGEGLPACDVAHARLVAMFFRSLADKIEGATSDILRGLVSRPKRPSYYRTARSFENEMISRGLFGDMWGNVKSWLRDKMQPSPTLSPEQLEELQMQQY